jgi:hypothetical protein
VSSTKRFTPKQFIFLGLSLLLIVVALEITIQLAVLFSSKLDIMISKVPRTPHSISDSVYGVRPNPDFPGHDAWGFRNLSVPTSADIVAMGDSQTYGTGISSRYNWPSKLDWISQKSVYNMSWGGYGPVHYYKLMDRALSLKPKLIVVAYYFGNDLYDSYQMVFIRKQCTELLTTQSGASSPLATVQPTIEPSPFTNNVKDSQNSWPHFFWNHSKLLGLVRPFKDVLRVDAFNFFYQTKIAKNPDLIFFKEGSILTTFDVLARLPGLDDTHPDVSQGFDLTLAALAQMNKRARENNILFGVVIIPTKESVFSPFFQSHAHKNNDVYQRIVESETRFESLLRHFLEDNSIPSFYVKTHLQNLIREGTSPYRISTDGHLNRFGQEIIATGILGWTDLMGN